MAESLYQQFDATSFAQAAKSRILVTRTVHPWHIAYDIADPKRLRRVERALSAVGERVHYSLFLCELTGADLAAVQARVARLIDTSVDSVRYTPLCAGDRADTRHLGRTAQTLRAVAWIV